jgi:uncharacterized protein (DUF983 family)
MGVKVATRENRDLGKAMWNGVKCRCPKCGEGQLFRAYLKVNDECPNCGEVFSHHRADDLPPYVAIFIVGHLLVGIMLHMEMVYHVNPAVYLYTMIPLAVILPLMLLPSIKGAIVALQWSKYMHGFDPMHRPEDEIY